MLGILQCQVFFPSAHRSSAYTVLAPMLASALLLGDLCRTLGPQLALNRQMLRGIYGSLAPRSVSLARIVFATPSLVSARHDMRVRQPLLAISVENVCHF